MLKTININITLDDNQNPCVQITQDCGAGVPCEPENPIAPDFVANCKIINNCAYPLTMTGAGAGNPDHQIIPHTEYSWSSSNINNTKSLLFTGLPNSSEMQGNLSFGPQSGVYVDRGSLPEDDQRIKMTAVANGKTFTQISNGGEQLLAWNEFENGGDITLTFEDA